VAALGSAEPDPHTLEQPVDVALGCELPEPASTPATGRDWHSASNWFVEADCPSSCSQVALKDWKKQSGASHPNYMGHIKIYAPVIRSFLRTRTGL